MHRRSIQLLAYVVPALCACNGCSVALADIGGTFAATGNDTVPRYFHAAGALADGAVMVTGGLGLNLIPPTLFSRDEISFYDSQAGTFTAQFAPLSGDPVVTPTLITPRSSHTQTLLPDGRVLITGGHQNASGTSPGTAIASVELFDPWTGAVSTGPTMSVSRAMHTATALPDGRVVVAGGASWQMFDWFTNTWSTNKGLARSRSAHAAVLLTDYAGTPGDDRVLLVGGGGSGPNTIELLDPATETTQLKISALAVGVDDLAAVALPDGRVFIVGGQDVSTGDTVATTYLFDPVADSIVAGPDVPNRTDGISDHEIFRVGAHVYVFGGEQEVSGADTELDYTAVFDSTTNTWLADDTMLSVHDDFASVALDHCTMLLIGGGVPLFGQEAPSSSAEILYVTDSAICVPGDLDNDGDVDDEDVQAFIGCCAGPTTGTSASPCAPADTDGDNDADLADFAVIQRQFSP